MANKERNRKCLCGNPECDELRKTVLSLLDNGPHEKNQHPWATGNGFTEIKHRKKHEEWSLKVEALRRSCAHHLKLGRQKRGLAKYRIASIHWPIRVMELQGEKRSLPLTKAEVQQLDKEVIGGSPLFDNVNLLKNLLKEYRTGPHAAELSKIGDMFAQAPVCRPNQVKDFIESLQSKRSQRWRVLQEKRDEVAEEEKEEGGVVEEDLVGDKEVDIVVVEEVATVNTPDNLPTDLCTDSLSPPMMNTPQYEAKLLHDAKHFLRSKYKLWSKERFGSDRTVRWYVEFLYVKKISFVELDDDSILIVCPNCDSSLSCCKFSVHNRCPQEARLPRLGLCSKCMLERVKQQRHDQRKRKHSAAGSDRASMESKVPHKYLSPESKAKWEEAASSERKRTKRKLKFFAEFKEQRDLGLDTADDKNVIGIVKEALDHCCSATNRTKLCEEIVTVIIGTEKFSDRRMEEAKEYAGAVALTIENYVKNLDGKAKTIRFDKRVLRSALAFWLQSPSAYDRLKENSIEILPSQ